MFLAFFGLGFDISLFDTFTDDLNSKYWSFEKTKTF